MSSLVIALAAPTNLWYYDYDGGWTEYAHEARLFRSSLVAEECLIENRLSELHSKELGVSVHVYRVHPHVFEESRARRELNSELD